MSGHKLQYTRLLQLAQSGTFIVILCTQQLYDASRNEVHRRASCWEGNTSQTPQAPDLHLSQGSHCRAANLKHKWAHCKWSSKASDKRRTNNHEWTGQHQACHYGTAWPSLLFKELGLNCNTIFDMPRHQLSLIDYCSLAFLRLVKHNHYRQYHPYSRQNEVQLYLYFKYDNCLGTMLLILCVSRFCIQSATSN